jgi:hypothetical protein
MSFTFDHTHPTFYIDTTQLGVATFCHRGIGAYLLYGRL